MKCEIEKFKMKNFKVLKKDDLNVKSYANVYVLYLRFMHKEVIKIIKLYIGIGKDISFINM